MALNRRTSSSEENLSKISDLDTAAEIDDCVLILPDWRTRNPYQNLLVESLHRRGIEATLADFPDGPFPLNRATNRATNVSVLHLHWINDLIAPILWGRGRIKRFAKLALLIADVLTLRLRGISVVWTIHNLVAHESPNRLAELRIRSALARACSHVILHGERARQRVEAAYHTDLSQKCTIIPHGNYDGCYPFSKVRREELLSQFSLDSRNTVILFFGAIRPYKGVRQLIEAFSQTSNQDLRLIVAGYPSTEQFRDEIASLAQTDRRISLVLDFVAVQDVAALFSVADAVALPFENTLSSGSVTLAMTMGKPTLLPDEARMLDTVSDDCALFFDSSETLTSILSTLNKDKLLVMGKSAKALADAMPWDKVAKLTETAYGS